MLYNVYRCTHCLTLKPNHLLGKRIIISSN